jgi:hypothetical protein
MCGARNTPCARRIPVMMLQLSFDPKLPPKDPEPEDPFPPLPQPDPDDPGPDVEPVADPDPVRL